MYDDILGPKTFEQGIESVDNDNNTKEAKDPHGTIGYGNSIGVDADDEDEQDEKEDVWDVNKEDDCEDCNCEDGDGCGC